MCRSVGEALVLAMCVLAVRAPAQGLRRETEEARALLARAESLRDDLARQDSAANRRLYLDRRARRFDAGPVTLLAPSAVGSATGRRLAASAEEYIRGVLPPEYVASRVVIAYAATAVDSVLQGENLSGRTRLGAYVAPHPDSLADGWSVAGAIARDYWESLEPTWRAWLPPDLGVAWTLRHDGPGATRALMRGDTYAGATCLAGSVAACRLWLGLDADANPYLVRYRPEELRQLVHGRWFPDDRANELAHQCTTGSDAACLQIASLGYLPSIPAGQDLRSSLLGYVRARPANLLVAALAGHSGSVGERLARAAGTTEDSLVAGWRIWLLTGGGQRRVTAGVRDALPVLVLSGLLLLAATKSGRWR
jgi:hypothetical protein